MMRDVPVTRWLSLMSPAAIRRIEEALAAAWAFQRHGTHPGSSSDFEEGWISRPI